jgi:dCTP deaminase
MTVLNQRKLLDLAPLSPMAPIKSPGPGGVSYGLTEAGYDIRIAQDVLLCPLRRFRLASTIERFDMPYNLVAVVHDKSTWARRGLSVFNTVIEPGWRGWLTLELVYHGWGVLRIPAGAGIAQAIFHKLEAPGNYGNGKYQDQENRPVAARDHKGI